MKNLIGLLLVTVSFSTAFARDSDWKLCTGDAQLFGEASKIALNVFEHRNSKGDGRVTDLMLIFGNNTLKGSFASTDSSSATVKLLQGSSVYKGVVSVDYDTEVVTLKGQLNLGTKTSVDSTLKCETLSH